MKTEYEVKVEWPALAPVHPDYTNAVQCDWCDAWYHFCCVGLSADVVLDEDAPFACPQCTAGGGVSRCAEQQQHDDPEHYCARPDCPLATTPLANNEFFVERIIGRRPSPESADAECQYYIKWEGYDIDEATWEDSSSLPQPVAERLVQEFEKRAALEGANVGDADDIILLNEVHLFSARALKARRAVK